VCVKNLFCGAAYTCQGVQWAGTKRRGWRPCVGDPPFI